MHGEADMRGAGKCLVDHANLNGETKKEKYESLKKIIDNMRKDSQVVVCGPNAFNFFSAFAEVEYPTSIILDDITYFLQEEMQSNYILIQGPNMIVELSNL